MKKSYLKKDHARIIGIAGAEKACGATHFLISSANYLSNVIGARVAVCNLMGDPDYRRLSAVLGGGEGNFAHANITFLVDVTEDELPKLSVSYDYVFLDLSYDFDRYQPLFTRCDQAFLLGALNEWRCNSLINNMLRLESFYKGKVQALATFGSKRGEKYYEKILHRSVIMLPFEPDPFCLHPCTLKAMEKIYSNEKR